MSRWGKEKEEPNQIGNDAWREEERSANQYGSPVHERLRRGTAARQFGPQIQKCADALLPRHPRPRHPCKEHEAECRPEPHDLTEANEESELENRHDYKQNCQATKDIHGAFLPGEGVFGPSEPRGTKVHGTLIRPRESVSFFLSLPLDNACPREVRMAIEQTYFRKGFGLKAEVQPIIDSEYHSALVERIRSRGYVDVFGDITIRLAQEFGFCYGVDRAIDYAYETRRKFPDRRLFLVGEIIHNPHVNARMQEMGIEFIYPTSPGVFDFSVVTPADVVIMPAFGVTREDFRKLSEIGCVLVDTTCGSVLLVWKRVESYARDGFTSVIHGKHHHEESRATASQASKHPDGRYILVRDMAETEVLCAYMTRSPGHISREEFFSRFGDKVSDGFDPDEHLLHIGVANQTTMLANESMAVGARLRKAMVEAHGEDYAAENFRSFGTICSATQERQDAVKDMMNEGAPDVMLVIGGYNSSNTNHLAHLCRSYTKTFHVKDADCIDAKSGSITHKPELDADCPEQTDESWMPEGPFQLGVTAGASTPNNKIGEALVRVLQIRGIDAALV